MPPLAREKSRAGAKAFVRHYIDVINYSWATGRGDELRDLSSPGCRECRSLAEAIDGFTRDGGYQLGGDWTAKRLFAFPTDPITSPRISATIHVAPGEWRESATGPKHTIKAETIVTDFDLRRHGASWLVTDVDQS
jgi:hypothetical protein